MNLADPGGRSLLWMSHLTGGTPLFTPRPAIDPPKRTGPYLVQQVGARRSGLKYRWAVVDFAVTPHRVVVSGTAWTYRRADRAAETAHEQLVKDPARMALLRQQAADADQLDAETQALAEGGCE